MADQAEVERWAKMVALAYANSCAIPISPFDVLDLAGHLGEPLAYCIMLAIPPGDWGPDYVNPVLDRWEAAMRRRRGKRLGAVDYGLEQVTMQ